ncbi:MAG TPA: methyltransferase domain-containing protein [Candidatus Dormibacteraeota bacterium]|nr:methyltransferase domain-containing protein [Candidatus Dormibacteraeota bacterium]
MRRAEDFTSPERLEQQYHDSSRLQTRVETHRRYAERKESFLGWLIDQLGPKPGDLVADIGCGPGNYFARLREIPVTMFGCDLSPGMVADANAAGMTAVVGDAQHIPFVSGSLDRVMCNHVLYHVADQIQALQELRRIARPGAVVVIATNGTDHLRALDDLARMAGRDLGTELPQRQRPFTLEDVDRVRQVFVDAVVRRFENCLVFPDPEPVLDYMRSWIGGTGPLEGAIRARIAEAIGRDGAFRVPTVAGCFVATA